MQRTTWALAFVATTLFAKDAHAARPRAHTTVPSAQNHPFLVHGRVGTEALLTRIRDAVDRAWRVEIVEKGWPAPPPDSDGPDSRFDVYVDPGLEPDEAYVMPEDEVPDTAWFDVTSYMVLPATFPDRATLFSIVAHELNHASQFALDATEDDAFFEHTSVLVEQKAGHHFPAYGVGIADYQAHPERALDTMGDDQYEYGAAMWLMFLDEHVGRGNQSLVRRLWSRSKQTRRTNTPHFLDALHELLQERGWSLPRFFATFSAWRYFTGPRDDGRHFASGREWGRSSLVKVQSLDGTDGPVIVRGRLGAFGTRLAGIEVPSGTEALEVRLSGRHAALAIVGLDSSGGALGDPVVVEEGGRAVSVALPSGTVKVLAALTYAPPHYDPNQDDWAKRSVAAVIEAE